MKTLKKNNSIPDFEIYKDKAGYIFILSNHDKIKNGDFHFDIFSKEIDQRLPGSYNDDFFKKVVATSSNEHGALKIPMLTLESLETIRKKKLKHFDVKIYNQRSCSGCYYNISIEDCPTNEDISKCDYDKPGKLMSYIIDIDKHYENIPKELYQKIIEILQEKI